MQIDLLIGAASTNQIVIYRTRPRLKLQPVVTNFQMRADSLAIYKLKREDLSFRLLFCISSQIQPKNDGKLGMQNYLTCSLFSPIYYTKNVDRDSSRSKI